MIIKKKNNSVRANSAKIRFDVKKKGGSIVSASVLELRGYNWVYFAEDPIFNDHLFNKFIGMFIKEGKRDRTLKIIYSLFGTSKKSRIPYFLFFTLLEKLKPSFVCVPTRSGKIINFVPMPTTEAKAYKIALRFLYKAIMDRKHDKTLQEKIFNEFEACFKEPGYNNVYAEENSNKALENSHLRHFRRFGVY